MIDFTDIDGKPLTLMEWAQLIEDPTYRIVGHDDVDGVLISTVWLGLGAIYHGQRRMAFETMIFGGDFNEWQQRWETVDDARAGHALVVRHLQAGLDPAGEKIEEED